MCPISSTECNVACVLNLNSVGDGISRAHSAVGLGKGYRLRTSGARCGLGDFCITSFVLPEGVCHGKAVHCVAGDIAGPDFILCNQLVVRGDSLPVDLSLLHGVDDVFSVLILHRAVHDRSGCSITRNASTFACVEILILFAVRIEPYFCRSLPVGRNRIVPNLGDLDVHGGGLILNPACLQGDVLLRHLEGIILTDGNIIRRPAVEGIAFLRRCRCERHRVAIPVRLLFVRFAGICIVVFIDIGNLFREVLNRRRINRNIGLRVPLVVLVAQACARVGRKGCSVRQSILVVLNIERERLCLVAELVRNIPCHSLVVRRRRDHGVGRVRFIFKVRKASAHRIGELYVMCLILDVGRNIGKDLRNCVHVRSGVDKACVRAGNRVHERVNQAAP